ncbi:MAG TPA: hypothetical protein VEK79_09780 [Thermoanaerobaculia bacterium]|nr:hypothetical protein [Thermoanaerobaculia bacterium]
MKRLAVVSILAFLFFVAANPEPPKPLGVRVTVAPTEDDRIQLLGPRSIPGAYRCQAQVYHATDPGYLLAMPEVVVSPGHKETKIVKEKDLSVTFTVGVSKENDRALTTVVVKRGETIVLHQASDVVLRAPKPAIVPLR